MIQKEGNLGVGIFLLCVEGGRVFLAPAIQRLPGDHAKNIACTPKSAKSIGRDECNIKSHWGWGEGEGGGRGDCSAAAIGLTTLNTWVGLSGPA